MPHWYDAFVDYNFHWNFLCILRWFDFSVAFLALIISDAFWTVQRCTGLDQRQQWVEKWMNADKWSFSISFQRLHTTHKQRHGVSHVIWKTIIRNFILRLTFSFHFFSLAPLSFLLSLLLSLFSSFLLTPPFSNLRTPLIATFFIPFSWLVCWKRLVCSSIGCSFSFGRSSNQRIFG